MRIYFDNETTIELIENYSNFICYLIEKTRKNKKEKSLEDLDIVNYKYYIALLLYHYEHFDDFYLENFIAYIKNDFNTMISFYDNIDNEKTCELNDETIEEIETMKDVYYYFNSLLELENIKNNLLKDLINLSPILLNKYNQERLETFRLIDDITNIKVVDKLFETKIPSKIKNSYKVKRLQDYIKKLKSPILFESNDEKINSNFRNLLLENKINEAINILNEKIQEVLKC